MAPVPQLLGTQLKNRAPPCRITQILTGAAGGAAGPTGDVGAGSRLERPLPGHTAGDLTPGAGAVLVVAGLKRPARITRPWNGGRTGGHRRRPASAAASAAGSPLAASAGGPLSASPALPDRRSPVHRCPRSPDRLSSRPRRCPPSRRPNKRVRRTRPPPPAKPIAASSRQHVLQHACSSSSRDEKQRTCQEKPSSTRRLRADASRYSESTRQGGRCGSAGDRAPSGHKMGRRPARPLARVVACADIDAGMIWWCLGSRPR